MKRLLHSLFVLGFILPRAWATSPVFENDGIFSYIMPPQAAPEIDSTIFINRGQFTIASGFAFPTEQLGTLAQPPLPYETVNTIAYSNFNVMVGDPGFRFDHYDTAIARRSPADSFFNAGNANFANAAIYGDDYLLVSAKQIVSHGTLATGDAGLLQLNSPDTIDLSRSTVGGLNADFDTGAYVQDLYWGANNTGANGGNTLIPAFPGNFDPLFFEPPVNDTEVLVNGIVGGVAGGIGVGVGGIEYLPFNQFFSLVNGYTYYEQISGNGGPGGEITVDALILAQTNSAISTAVEFSGFAGSEKIVQFLAYSTNRVTGAIRTNTLYFSDLMPLYSFQPPTSLGLAQALPGNIYYANYLFDNAMATFRPAEILPGATNNVIVGNLFNGGVFTVARGSPITFLATNGATFFGNIFPSTFDPILYTTTNRTPFPVTNASWGARISAAPFTPNPSIQNAGYTNLAGRIEINAKVLDLSNVRIDGDSSLVVKADHFIGSANAEVIAPVSNFDLRSTNGNLTIANLTTPTIPRINGLINCWSGRWTATTNDNTLGVTIHFHVTIVDAQFNTEAPSQVENLTLRATNLIVSDVLNVFANLSLPETQRLTITTNPPEAPTLTGEINLSQGNLVWSTSFPNLQYLTNNGSITSSNTLYFGTATQPPFTGGSILPYQSFVTHDVIASQGGLQISAKYFEASGSNYAATAPITVQAVSATVTNGLWLAPTADIDITSGSLLISNQLMLAGRSINLAATNLLSDGVPNIATLPLTNQLSAAITNGNIWVTSFGLSLAQKPSFGDLLGTTIFSTAFPNQEVPILWSGEDRGTANEGFLNNAAIGHLILSGTTNSLFNFKASGANNAIYIDSLEFQDYIATNIDAQGNFRSFFIDPNMKVYFAQAIANGVSIAEKLAQSGNGFIWVSNFNYGYFSSTNMVYPDGSTNRVNAALAGSCDIDSDGDLTVNCLDLSPIPVIPWINPPTDVPGVAAIAVQPLSATVFQGGPAAFSVVAPGALGYQWSFNGVNIAGATSNAFTIASTQPQNAGSYSVAVATPVGLAFSAEAFLTVDVAPSIISQSPASVTNVVGTTATFSVSVAGTAPLAYQWRFNAADIPGATLNSYSIPSVQSSNAGNYSVVITNLVGLVTSANIGLVVQSTNPGSGPSTNPVAGPPRLDLPPPGLTSGATNFALTQGTYNGLFADTGAVAVASSGSFSVKTTARGAYSGKIMLAGKPYSLSGTFATNGAATKVIHRANLSDLTVQLKLDLSGANQITGTISDGHWTAALLADRATKSKSPARNYTLVISPPNTNSLFGFGFGTVKVDSAGNVQWSGTLADGTKVTQSSTISSDGFWPLYASLYTGKGLVISWMQFTNQTASDLEGDVIWLKPGGIRAAYYPTGFTNDFMALGSLYTHPAAGSRVLNLATGKLAFSGLFTDPISLDARNRITSDKTNRLTFTLVTGTGLFNGNALNRQTGRPLPFQGVLYQKTTNGFGLFFSGAQSGAVSLSP